MSRAMNIRIVSVAYNSSTVTGVDITHYQMAMIKMENTFEGDHVPFIAVCVNEVYSI